MIHEIKCLIYKNYLKVIWSFRKNFGIKAYGIGWAASRIGREFDFNFKNAPFRFVPSAARSYCLLPAGVANEPETHIFLDKVLKNKSNVLFVDVGASIGEFAVTLAYDGRIAKVLAFEPHPNSFAALQKSAQKASAGKIELVKKGVSATSGKADFSLSMASPTAAGINAVDKNAQSQQIELCTLDEVLVHEKYLHSIIMIDIEGGELDALKGGLAFIQAAHPLIIFEYNKVTEKVFKLTEVQKLFGSAYKLYRLRHAHYKGSQSTEAGCLDEDLTNTWNIVALPSAGPWKNISNECVLFATGCL